MRWSLCLVASLSLFTLPAPSGAQAQGPATPPEMVEDGQRALREGRFEDALHIFRTAARASPDPVIWLWVGDAADRLRDDASALEAYETYLRARPEAADAVEVSARVAVLAPRVRRRRPRAHFGEASRRGLIPASAIIRALRDNAGRSLGAP